MLTLQLTAMKDCLKSSPAERPSLSDLADRLDKLFAEEVDIIRTQKRRERMCFGVATLCCRSSGASGSRRITDADAAKVDTASATVAGSVPTSSAAKSSGTVQRDNALVTATQLASASSRVVPQTGNSVVAPAAAAVDFSASSPRYAVSADLESPPRAHPIVHATVAPAAIVNTTSAASGATATATASTYGDGIVADAESGAVSGAGSSSIQADGRPALVIVDASAARSTYGQSVDVAVGTNAAMSTYGQPSHVVVVTGAGNSTYDQSVDVLVDASPARSTYDQSQVDAGARASTDPHAASIVRAVAGSGVSDDVRVSNPLQRSFNYS